MLTARKGHGLGLYQFGQQKKLCKIIKPNIHTEKCVTAAVKRRDSLSVEIRGYFKSVNT